MKKAILLLFTVVLLVMQVTASANADLVIMKNGLRHKCKVIEDNPDKDHIVVRVIYGAGKTGTVTILRRNIDRIEYDYESRLERLNPEDMKGHYELALYCIENGMETEAAEHLQKCAGKPGVPADAWLLLGKLQAESGDLQKAKESLSAYIAANPADKEAAALLEQINKQLAPTPTPATSAKPTSTPVPTTTPTATPASSPTLTVKVIEGLETGNGWDVANWAGRGSLALRETDGNKILVFDFDPVSFQKSVCYKVFENPIALDKASAFNVSAFNVTDKPVQLALAVLVGENTTTVKYFESPLKLAPSSKWAQLAFDLTAANWKSSPKWEHNEKLPSSKIWAVYLLVYPGQQAGTIYFDAISFSNGEK
ncbi:MAG: hypothetical protein Kow00107_07150 [Planctomycetota bacterium]